MVAIVPAVGECLYAQRSMGAVHDSFARKDVVFLRVDDPSHPTADVTEVRRCVVLCLFVFVALGLAPALTPALALALAWDLVALKCRMIPCHAS